MLSERSLRIGLILLLAAAIRFHGLADQGVFNYDETCHLIDAAKLRADVIWCGKAVMSKIDGRPLPAVYREYYFGNLPRPLHFAMLAALKTESASLLAMATLGVISIFLVFLLGEHLVTPLGGGEKHGAGQARLGRSVSYLPEFAALLMALSPAHAFYSRTVLAEVNALFFFLLGCWYYPKARLNGRGRLYAVGALFGFMFTTNYRMATILPFLLAAEVVENRSLGRIVRLVGGFLIPVVFFEAFYDVLKFIYAIADTPMWISTYTDQLVQAAIDARGILRFNKPWFGIRYITYAEGFPTLILFMASAVILAVRLRRPDDPVQEGVSPKNRMIPSTRAALFWIGFGLWIIALASFFDQLKPSMSGNRYGRMLGPAIPALALGAAITLDFIWRRNQAARIGKSWKILCVACLVAIGISRLELLGGVMNMSAGHNRILHDVAARTGTAKFFSEQPNHIFYYLGVDSYPKVFSPRTDSITVIVFDEGLAKCYPFYYILPDTPTFTIDGIFRPSRLGEFEEGLNGLDRWPEPKSYEPVKVWVLGPEKKSKIYKLF